MSAAPELNHFRRQIRVVDETLEEWKVALINAMKNALEAAELSKYAPLLVGNLCDVSRQVLDVCRETLNYLAEKPSSPDIINLEMYEVQQLLGETTRETRKMIDLAAKCERSGYSIQRVDELRKLAAELESLRLEHTVYLLPEEDGGFSAFAADLPGCVSQGDTQEEALANIRESMEALIATYRKQGQPIPWEAGDALRWAAEEGGPEASLISHQVISPWLSYPMFLASRPSRLSPALVLQWSAWTVATTS